MMQIVTAENGNTLPRAQAEPGHDGVSEKYLYYSVTNTGNMELKEEQTLLLALERRAAAAGHALVNLRTEDESKC